MQEIDSHAPTPSLRGHQEMTLKVYEEPYLSEEDLHEDMKKVWDEINADLNSHNPPNKLFVFDFTFVLHTNQHVDVISTYIFIHKSYPDLLREFMSSGQALLKTDNAIVKSFANIDGKGGETCDPVTEQYEGSFLHAKLIEFSEWHLFLKSKDYGGCSYVLFNRLGLDKGEEEQIELGIYCILESPIEENEASLTSAYLERRLYQFLLTTGQKYALQHYLKQVKQQATRAAISQVMARNMSHNIGSHVMNRLTDGKKLEDVNVNNFESYRSGKVTGDESKIIHQVSIFNNYVKCRMDYLSDITFGIPVMHTNKKVCGELFKELDRVRLLWEFISGLSKFKYEIQCRFNGKLLCAEMDDISIAMPNDLLGCQAFYNIIENIIRNTAKHSTNKTQKTIFTVDIREIDQPPSDGQAGQDQPELFYAVEIYDDCVMKGDDGRTFGDGEKVSNIDWLVYSQNKKINQSVLQQRSYQLRTSSLGLMEMEASAAYLRKLDITAIEDEQYSVDYNDALSNASSKKFNILKAINKDGKLGYRFFVSRPTEVLFVGDYGAGVDVNGLLKLGIWLRSTSAFEAELDKGFVYNHSFVLYESPEVVTPLLREHQTSLPPASRLIDITGRKGEVEELLAGNVDFGAIEEFVWKLLFDSIRPAGFDDVCVWQSYQPDKAEHNNPKSYNIALTPHALGWKQRVEERESNLAHYLEPLPSHAQKKLPDFSGTLETYIESRITDVVKYKLFESAVTKVLVIDERIQRFTRDSYKSDGLRIPNEDIYGYANIVVPSQADIKLDADNYTAELIEKVERFITHNIDECRFLLLHYSILERMYVSIEAINEKLVGWSKRARVIVTSGRGKPPELPSQHVCFINLSPVLNVFVEGRSKYAINYLLQSSRR